LNGIIRGTATARKGEVFSVIRCRCR